MNALTLDVTGSDIADGKRCNTHQCPIALAAQRYMQEHQNGQIAMAREFGCEIKPKLFDVWVERTYIQLDYDGYTHIFLMPASAIDFANRFDEKRPVHPFQFTAHLDYKY